MTAHALRWLSAACVQGFAADVDRAVAAWAAAWGLEGTTAGIARIAAAAEFREARSAAEWQAVDPVCGPWVYLPEGIPAAFAANVFGQHCTESALAVGVGRRASAALKAALGTLLRPPAVPPAAEDVPDDHPGDFGIRYSSTVASTPLGILVSSAWLEGRGWMRRPTRPAAELRTIAAAALPLHVALQADLGVAELSVGELCSMAVGDVILCRDSTSTPIRLTSPAGSLHLHGFLGRSDSRRAIKLVNPSGSTP